METGGGKVGVFLVYSAPSGEPLDAESLTSAHYPRTYNPVPPVTQMPGKPDGDCYGHGGRAHILPLFGTFAASIPLALALVPPWCIVDRA